MFFKLVWGQGTQVPPPPLQLKIAGQWTVDSKLDSGQWTVDKNWTVMDSGQWTKIWTVHLLQLIFRGQWTVDKNCKFVSRSGGVLVYPVWGTEVVLSTHKKRYSTKKKVKMMCNLGRFLLG